MIKDYLGNELVVGDVVVHYEEKGAGFRLARVIGFTPKRVNLRSIFKDTSMGMGEDVLLLQTSKLEQRLIRVAESEALRALSDQEVFEFFERKREVES